MKLGQIPETLLYLQCSAFAIENLERVGAREYQKCRDI